MEPKYDYVKISSIFPKIKNIKKYSSTPESIGNVPFVTSSSLNNGVASYVEEISFVGNCITVSTNGKCFDSFYHEGAISISTDVELLTNENLNAYNALYICTILNAETFKWGYGRKPKNDKVFETSIKLPIIKKNKPDWEYMEDYIKTFVLKDYSFGKIKNCMETNNLNPLKLKIYNESKEVKLFKFSSILDKKLYKAKAYAKIDLEVSDIKRDGYIPFVSRTDVNNGVDCYVKDDESLQKEAGNCIIIGDTTATIYYQPNSFLAGDHIVVCRQKWINKFTALYIKTLLDKERYRYSYGRAFKKDFINDTILALPINESGNPDWEYMENYIKSLPYSDRI